MLVLDGAQDRADRGSDACSNEAAPALIRPACACHNWTADPCTYQGAYVDVAAGPAGRRRILQLDNWRCEAIDVGGVWQRLALECQGDRDRRDDYRPASLPRGLRSGAGRVRVPLRPGAVIERTTANAITNRWIMKHLLLTKECEIGVATGSTSWPPPGTSWGMTKRHQWTRDELVLTLALYAQGGMRRSTDPEVIRLAADIGRSPSAVSMRLANFVALDPTLPDKGYAHWSDDCRRVWDEFADKSGRLRTNAADIRRRRGFRT